VSTAIVNISMAGTGNSGKDLMLAPAVDGQAFASLMASVAAALLNGQMISPQMVSPQMIQMHGEPLSEGGGVMAGTLLPQGAASGQPAWPQLQEAILSSSLLPTGAGAPQLSKAETPLFPAAQTAPVQGEAAATGVIQGQPLLPEMTRAPAEGLLPLPQAVEEPLQMQAMAQTLPGQAEGKSPPILQTALPVTGSQGQKQNDLITAPTSVNAEGAPVGPLTSIFTPVTGNLQNVKDAPPAQQIAEQVQVTLEQGEQSATIRLHPETLGSVRVRLQVLDGQLHLSIQADRVQTEKLIGQSAGELRQTLESSGIKVGELTVLAGSRTQVAGLEGLQREAVQSLRTMQMEMGGNANQQQNQQQAAFAGHTGAEQQRQGSEQYGSGERSGAENSHPSGIAMSTAQHNGLSWTPAPAGVDYYA
jgi:hypothetical protein